MVVRLLVRVIKVLVVLIAPVDAEINVKEIVQAALVVQEIVKVVQEVVKIHLGVMPLGVLVLVPRIVGLVGIAAEEIVIAAAAATVMVAVRVVATVVVKVLAIKVAELVVGILVAVVVMGVLVTAKEHVRMLVEEIVQEAVLPHAKAVQEEQ